MTERGIRVRMLTWVEGWPLGCEGFIVGARVGWVGFEDGCRKS